MQLNIQEGTMFGYKVINGTNVLQILPTLEKAIERVKHLNPKLTSIKYILKNGKERVIKL